MVAVMGEQACTSARLTHQPSVMVVMVVVVMVNGGGD